MKEVYVFFSLTWVGSTSCYKFMLVVAPALSNYSMQEESAPSEETSEVLLWWVHQKCEFESCPASSNFMLHWALPRRQAGRIIDGPMRLISLFFIKNSHTHLQELQLRVAGFRMKEKIWNLFTSRGRQDVQDH